jgi:hypothetical protein
MLGRLKMSIDECIKAYRDLSKDIFHKKRRIPMNVKGDLKERYDSKALESAVKKILKERNLDEDVLLRDPGGTKVSVHGLPFSAISDLFLKLRVLYQRRNFAVHLASKLAYTKRKPKSVHDSSYLGGRSRHLRGVDLFRTRQHRRTEESIPRRRDWR